MRGKNKRTPQSKIDATPPWEERVRERPPVTTGPFDETDAPDDEVVRADLGALRVPATAGLDLRLELNEQQQVIGVTLAGQDGHMQLGVFAAPRTEGIWDSVREEIAESLRQQKGTPKERTGNFGAELTGTVPADGGGGGGRVPVRFIGVDGPRWFLRAMLVGVPSDPQRAARYEDVLRNVVVVRGNEPLPVRDAVPLRLPKEIVLPEELNSEAGNPELP
jgi:hypothetical protein